MTALGFDQRTKDEILNVISDSDLPRCDIKEFNDSAGPVATSAATSAVLINKVVRSGGDLQRGRQQLGSGSAGRLQLSIRWRLGDW
jgi:hypothetical protein